MADPKKNKTMAHLGSMKQVKQLCSERDWSGLEEGLLELILSKLSFINTIRFDVVCSSWHNVVRSYIRSSRYTECSSQLPWLLLPLGPDADIDHCTFYDIEENKTYKIARHESLLLSEPFWCIGSSSGWLILLSKIDKKVFLVNPFSRVKVSLPQLVQYMDDDDDDNKNVITVKPCRHIVKSLVLSNSPCDENLIIVLLHKGNIITFYKIGGDRKKWCYARAPAALCRLPSDELGHGQRYTDIIYGSDRLVYALTTQLTIEVWDFQQDDSRLVRKIRTKLNSKKECTNMYNYYLVESSGKLLLVLRYLKCDSETCATTFMDTKSPQHSMRPYNTKFFHVYELDPDAETWVLVNSIGNRILFTGRGGHMSLLAKDFRATSVEEDSIHFTDTFRTYCGHDHGVFHLQTTSVNPHLQHDLPRKRPPPLWITPKKCQFAMKNS